MLDVVSEVLEARTYFHLFLLDGKTKVLEDLRVLGPASCSASSDAEVIRCSSDPECCARERFA